MGSQQGSLQGSVLGSVLGSLLGSLLGRLLVSRTASREAYWAVLAEGSKLGSVFIVRNKQGSQPGSQVASWLRIQLGRQSGRISAS